MLIQKVKDTLFWKYQFNNIWERHFRRDTEAERIFGQYELNKQKYFWREERGRLRRYSPRKAAYNAFKELADEWRWDKKYKDESELLKVAHLLESLFPYTDEDGNYQNKEEALDEPWRGLAKRFWRNWDAKMSQEKAFETELQSYRFDVAKVNQAWEDLKIGKIPSIANIIWKASYPRKWAKEIISEANVSIKDFCFWMCVFKLHLGYHEQVVSGKHMYIGSDKALSEVISSKIPDNQTPL